MALKKREKTLLAVTAVLLAAILGKVLLGLYGGDTAKLRAARDKLLADNTKARETIAKSRQAQLKLVEWRTRSLPSDPQEASRVYQNWLLKIGDKTQFKGVKIDPGEIRPVMDTADRANRKPIYHKLSLSIHGQATLEQLTQWLFEFYQGGYLHKIESLSIKPTDGARALDLAITVEALVLPDAVAKTDLPGGLRSPLAESDPAKYRAAIVDRNLFAAYTPPRPEPRREEPPPPSFDPSRYVFITAIVQVDGKPQVWIEARTTGEKFQLHEGQSFQVGPLKGTILQIDSRHVQAERDGKHYLVALGESLHDAIEIP